MADEVKDLIVRLTLENDKFKQELKKVKKAMKDGQKQSKGLMARLKSIKAGYFAAAASAAG